MLLSFVLLGIGLWWAREPFFVPISPWLPSQAEAIAVPCSALFGAAIGVLFRRGVLGGVLAFAVACLLFFSYYFVQLSISD
jgi:hypothetical protein